MTGIIYKWNDRNCSKVFFGIATYLQLALVKF